MSLPIFEVIPSLKNHLQQHTTLILQAPPGAGKSTALPLELLSEPWLAGKKMILLEPRRLAARSVAMRMASLLGEEVGETVGYRVRFESKISAKTRIEVVTEGILTRMLQHDNSLEGVGIVVFDEFHERSLHADLALALCREVQQVLREDLKLLIMSATLDGEGLSKLLGGVPILTSQGRQYPVKHLYMGNDADTPMPKRMASTIKRALREQDGDLLCFLPGAGEINKVAALLEQELAVSDAVVLPLYGDLSPKQQQEAILPHPNGQRKIVLATSIAETSLTIEGVKVVVDSGLARGSRFDAQSGLTKMETRKVTQDAAEQRAGRAGRLGPGVCYRLWSEASHHQLVAHRSPEILEADLAPMTLELAQWGVQDMRSLTWLTVPPLTAVNKAKELLVELECLKENRITDKGKDILQLPTHPRLAHLLLEGKAKGMLALATDVAAVLDERDPLPRESGANLALRIEMLRKWRSKEHVLADRATLERIERLALAWRKLFKLEVDNQFPRYEHIGLLIAAAYPERIAMQREPTRYRLANGKIAKLPTEHDELVREKWLAIAHLDAGTNEGRIYLAAPVLLDDLAHLLHKTETVRWDSQKGVLLAQNELRLGDIIVKTTPLEHVSEESKTALLCQAVQQEGLGVLDWTPEVQKWQARVLSAKQWRPEEEWPDVSATHLLATTEDWLAPYLAKVRKREDFLKLDLLEILQSMLPWAVGQQLEQIAPANIAVPSGFTVPLQYFEDGRDPVLAVRLQEMFGLLDTPTVNGGRTKVLLHLLSPGYKPVQVTQDLRSFWQNTYPEVRKELRVRYQKHHWPEDPWTAEAMRGTKRQNGFVG